jgi:hypothetical protein
MLEVDCWPLSATNHRNPMVAFNKRKFQIIYASLDLLPSSQRLRQTALPVLPAPK